MWNKATEILLFLLLVIWPVIFWLSPYEPNMRKSRFYCTMKKISLSSVKSRALSQQVQMWKVAICELLPIPSQAHVKQLILPRSIATDAIPACLQETLMNVCKPTLLVKQLHECAQRKPSPASSCIETMMPSLNINASTSSLNALRYPHQSTGVQLTPSIHFRSA